MRDMNYNHRHSIFCTLPPQMIRGICERGSAKQRAAALKSLTCDTTWRTMRAAPRMAAARPAAVAELRKQRTIYSANGQETLPGEVVRTEGSKPTGDEAVDEAYDGFGCIYDFFSNVYDRNSVDDKGMPLDATVHYGDKYMNAHWNGERMVLGDGDGDFFNRFTIAIDIMGHELTHGVTDAEGGLVYFSQSGALNEHISDVFGSMTKQYSLQQDARQADWLIGSGLVTDKVNGEALRSMKAPGTAYNDPVLGKDTQPGHMKDYVQTWEDNGGIYINSGIPNRAFYLVASELGGYAWEKAGRIWYETLQDPALRFRTGFHAFATLTITVAERLFGFDSTEHRAVREGWSEVGINVK
jgi:Zn-dependent metalloprotease